MNKRLRKKKGIIQPSINERLASLLGICIENGLNLNYSANSGSIFAHDPKNDFKTLTRGYIKEWVHETPENVLIRMEREVKEYVDGN